MGARGAERIAGRGWVRGAAWRHEWSSLSGGVAFGRHARQCHRMEDARGAVLLYDGECGLCRALVRWLAQADRRRALRFAPLQGGFAQAALHRCGLPTTDFDSLVFMPEILGTNYSLRTAGVIAALSSLGGGWRVIARLLAVLPVSWRDAAYRGVARVRYRIFGRVMFRADEPPDPKRAERFLT